MGFCGVGEGDGVMSGGRGGVMIGFDDVGVGLGWRVVGVMGEGRVGLVLGEGVSTGVKNFSLLLLKACTIEYINDSVRLVRHANHRWSISRLLFVSDESSISADMVVSEVSGRLYKLLMSRRRPIVDKGMLK